MPEMENRFLDYIAYVTLIVAAILIGESVSSIWEIFNAISKYLHDEKSIIYLYQVLFTGLAAVFAAWITAKAIRRQISEDNKNNNRQLEIQNLQFRHSLNHRAFAIASSFSGDISSLVFIAKQKEYLEIFKEQKKRLMAGSIPYVTAFPLTDNYFIVFDSLCKEVGLLMDPLSKEICTWYGRVRGFLDTIKGINAGVYHSSNQIFLVDSLIEELTDLEKKGESLIKTLDNIARDKKTISITCEMLIDKKLAETK